MVLDNFYLHHFVLPKWGRQEGVCAIRGPTLKRSLDRMHYARTSPLPKLVSGVPCAPIALMAFTFRRQHAIGPYIVDFCAPREKLIIEVDGGQHLDQEEYDQERTAFLASKRYQVLRFWNNDITINLESVLRQIFDNLHQS